ncbi:uncharacterized protein BJ171DRAFT_577242 [Polychytrium aggregatum]|uniref:uncharacterized protein n=1 Tax=Polychytrium aggregatum TaxID=110093 RepID=UPI0022FE474A|nr:uncharacterized protein BJ171DRAFT_577242 [Polychytrium aggregatum]KAI9208898.1 hypothetical protein BJ171DRAFT_577242 [Polychytrium aggregatum]
MLAETKNVVLIPVDSVSDQTRSILNYAFEKLITPADEVVVLNVLQHNLEATLDEQYERLQLEEASVPEQASLCKRPVDGTGFESIIRHVATARTFEALVREIVKAHGASNKVGVSVVYGEARGIITMEMQERRPRLILMGSHKKGIRPSLGSIVSHVVHRAECPVLVLPNTVVSTTPATQSGPKVEIQVC